MASLGLNELLSITSMLGLIWIFRSALKIPLAWAFLLVPTSIIYILFLGATLNILAITRESIQITGNLYFISLVSG
jgi:hypothetical protein